MIRTSLAISLALVFLVGHAVAQPIPANAPPEAVLKAVLQLSDEQIQSIQALGESRRAGLEPLVAQMRERQEALQAAIQSDSADAMRIGELILSMRAIARQFEEHEGHYRQAVGALLTNEQRERVAAIHAIELAVHAAGILREFGL